MKRFALSRLLAAGLALCLAAGVLSGPATAADSSGYSDVRASDWYYQDVRFVTENGLMLGTGSGFDPAGKLSRGMLVTILYRAEGSPEAGGTIFSDVRPNAWYARGTAWASENDIVTGYYDGSFLPDDPVTREQLAVILYRYAKFKGVSVKQRASLAVFSDTAALPDWSSDSLSWAVAVGLIQGSDGALSPGGAAFRAQTAAVLRRFSEKVCPLTGSREEESGTITPASLLPTGADGFNSFDSSLLAYLAQHGYGDRNYLVSPLSLRAALALAAAGAGGQTETALLGAMGFSGQAEVKSWYAGLLNGVQAFEEGLEQEKAQAARYPELYGGSTPDRAYRIVNSVWHNSDKPGGFREDYASNVRKSFDATVADAKGAALATRVNNWVNQQTAGMIPALAEDLKDAEAVLVNALYLRTAWVDVFSAGATRTASFTTAEGQTVLKDYMRREDDYRYYEDDDTRLVILPMQGNMYAAFVLGDRTGILDKLNAAKTEDVIVTLPKLELETTLDGGVLAGYLRDRGASVAFTNAADFTAMCTGASWKLDDIIQKSKLTMDEDGIEAAAATAIMMAAGAAPVQDPPAPKEFTADRPFSLYLYTRGDGGPELLFFGQYLR